MRKGRENARSDNVLLLKPKFSDTLRPSDATNSEPISSIKNLVERIIPRVPPRIVESTLHLVRRLPARGRRRPTHIWPTPLPPALASSQQLDARGFAARCFFSFEMLRLCAASRCSICFLRNGIATN
jgi:hypothetical protein